MENKNNKKNDMGEILKEILEFMVDSISIREGLKNLIKTHEEQDEAWLKKELNTIGGDKK